MRLLKAAVHNLLPFTILLACAAQAQTFSVIHSFTGGEDGYQPFAGVYIDGGGNLYGTTTEYSGPGTVYKMTFKNGAWTLNTLFTFYSGNGLPGFIPQARVVPGPGGALYGTTSVGGNGPCWEFGCGTVYSLRPSRNACGSFNCPWTGTLVYSFSGDDGNQPNFVDPVFDAAGNMYGTTIEGGVYSLGNVWQLTRSNGQWTETSIHDFDITDGAVPFSGVTLDAQGNVYGTSSTGGPSPNGVGTVFELTHSGSGWTLNTLHTFTGPDGSGIAAGVIFDAQGNLYGATLNGGASGGGTVFELSPSGGGWNISVLYSFSGQDGPIVSLTMDASGNLYGTTYADGAFGYGSVFKLTRSGGSWTYTDLHDFTNGADGANPISNVAINASGKLYGTTTAGGTSNNGVVWEITQ